MRFKNRIKSAALLLACCFVITACGGQDNSSEQSSAASGSSAQSSSEGNGAPSGGGQSGGESAPAAPRYDYPTEDIPETVSRIHDFSMGNGVYNANITDTSNEERYYANFDWTNDAKILWKSGIGEKPWGEYDDEAALAYGKVHWCDGVGLCAEFLSRCVTAGGITEFTDSSTSIALQLMHSGLGFGQFVRYNKSDHTITLPMYARPGDVVQIYCSFEGVMIHSLLMVGTDDEGKLRVVCHNYRNSGEFTFHIDDLNDPCYDCESETVEVFFYHFYRDDDFGLPAEVKKDKDIVLWEEKAYVIPNETYDREAALAYAAKYREDGFGFFGAEHTSEILQAGGLTIGYPNQSALFFQLLKSHLGTAESLKVREDRTVIPPEYAEAGDICFVYCPYDGIITSSFIISEMDKSGRIKAHSYDFLNDGTSAFKVDSYCAGCGEDIKEVILYHFDDQ